MRALSIICGIAVIITTFAAMGAAVLMGVLSLIGGCLLIKGNR